MQITAFLTALAAVAACFLVLFKFEWKIALLALLPNVLPVVAILGLLGWLAIPLGVLVFYFGLMSSDSNGGGSLIAAYALAFSAGTFLCIASSDLLPELQFHQHDRGKLSAALLLGLGVAVGVAWLESVAGTHTHGDLPATSAAEQ